MIYRVEGFTFENEEEARLADKEAEGIKYIRERNDMSDPDRVLMLYNRLIEKEVFATPVGFSFLAELRSFLLAEPDIRRQELLPLPGGVPAGEDSAGTGRESERKEAGGRGALAAQEPAEPRGRDYYRPFLVSTFLAAVMAAALLGIFIIMAVSSDNITILNYEDQLIDRYESWEEELKRREEELKRRERELEQDWPHSQAGEDAGTESGTDEN